jgi:hypothetical protein
MHASAAKSSAMDRNDASNVHISAYDAFTRYLASNDHREKEVMSFQSLESRQPM